MSGYTPVFDTVFDGSLCGKWPDLAVWLTILPLADWRGHIDMTPEAIAARTGWPLELLQKGIATLTSPDPRSRSKSEDGRRLIPIDPDRDWGWRVVNIQIYRQKASGANQVADGRNAAKVARYKTKRRDTAGHRETPPDTNSYTDTNIGKKPAGQKGSRIPPDFQPDQSYAKQQIPDIDASAEAAGFVDYWTASGSPTAVKRDWNAAWRTWIRNCKTSGRYARRSVANGGMHAGVVMR